MDTEFIILHSWLKRELQQMKQGSENDIHHPTYNASRLQETGEPVGVVVNVFDSGANDLLHVKLDSSVDNVKLDSSVDKSQEDETLKLGSDKSTPLVWIPFVEAIVPDIDLNKKEMLIIPPKGLLELNIRSNERSKKERRQLEWKERKNFQKRLIAAKKKLCEMEQQHVFDGFCCGEKDQRSSLADQIVNVNSKLLQQAMVSAEAQPKRSISHPLLKHSRKG